MKTPTGSPYGRAITIAIAVILSASPLAAGSGGSVYSRFGVGDLRTTFSTGIFALGGTAAAWQPAGSINDVNPATWSGISRVRFSAAALYEGFLTSDGSASAYMAGTAIDGLSLLIPIDSGRGLTFGGGIVPYSRVNYNIVEPVDQAGLSYTLTRIGEGGISRAFAGLSVSVVPGLNAAARFDFFFGSNSYTMTQTFDGTTYAGADLTRTESVRGGGGTFGVLYESLGRVFGLAEGQTLALGLSMTTASWPTVTEERIYNYHSAASSNPLDTLNGDTQALRLPFSLTGGLSFSAGKVLAAADIRYQDWEGTTFETTPSVRLRKSVRVSAGAEIARDAGPGVSRARSVTYMFGAYHDAGYLEIGGERISENGITAGIAFPILAETRLSLAAGFSMRGTTDNLLQEDKIFRISASMDIAEFWFQRPTEE
jgi:hypothetical protein